MSHSTRYQPGDIVKERYEIEAFLRASSTGQVFRARHVRLGNTVAVQVHPTSATGTDRARLDRSAYVLARVRGPHVASMLDYWVTHQGEPVVITELVAGPSLRDVLQARGAMPWPCALKVGVEILRGLQSVHEVDVLNRNLSPDAVAVDPGPPERVKLTDLGLATSTRGDTKRVTRAGEVVGPMPYLAPEVAVSGQATVQSDLYSVAMILWELLAGALPNAPFRVSHFAARQIAAPAPPSPPAGRPPIEPALLALVTRALAPDPAQRPESAAAFVSALLRIRDASGVRAVVDGAIGGELPLGIRETIPIRLVSDRTTGRFVGPSDGSRAPLRGLVAVRLPPGALDTAEVRGWFSARVGPADAGFRVGDRHWVVALAGRSDVAVGELLMAFSLAVHRHFGNEVAVSHRLVDEGFEISDAALDGSAAPPIEVLELLNADPS